MCSEHAELGGRGVEGVPAGLRLRGRPPGPGVPRVRALGVQWALLQSLRGGQLCPELKQLPIGK